MKNLKSNNLLKFIIGAVILIALPWVIQAITGNSYWVMILCIMCLYIIAVSGLDVLFGYSGQISMGHAGFFVIGAYCSAILVNRFNLPKLVTILVAALLAMVIGAALAYPASRLKFHFLSLATIAFGEIVYNFVFKSPGGITGDAKGLNTTTISFLGDSYMRWYYFMMVLALLFIMFKLFIEKSRTGRAFMAIRENTHAADGMGVNVQKYKIMAFAISAFYTGFAGALYVHLIKFISPETSMQKQSVLFVTMMLFGGNGTVAGTVAGVVVLEILLELIRPLQEYQMLLYGILLLVVILALPGGMVGGAKDVMTAMKRRKLQKEEEKGGAQNA